MRRVLDFGFLLIFASVLLESCAPPPGPQPIPTPLPITSTPVIAIELPTAAPTITPTITLSPTPAGSPTALFGTQPSSVGDTFAPTQDSFGGCEPDSEFVRDVSIPDGTPIELGATFEKTWRVENTGTCSWDASYFFVQIRGDNLSTVGGPVALPVALPGDIVDITVVLELDDDAVLDTIERAQFQMRGPDGMLFGTRPFVDIRVVSATTGTLAGFMERLKTALSAQEYGSLQSLMSSSFGINVWQAGSVPPIPRSDALNRIQSEYLPLGSEVVFGEVDLGGLGIDKESYWGTEKSVQDVLFSAGWGKSGRAQALIVVIQQNGRYQWSDLIYAPDGF
jgi:hypothetical protein